MVGGQVDLRHKDYRRFRSLLQIMPYRWRLSAHGAIRAGRGRNISCPLTAVARQVIRRSFRLGQYLHAGVYLDLPLYVIAAIQKATDGVDNYDQDLRRDLLCLTQLAKKSTGKKRR